MKTPYAFSAITLGLAAALCLVTLPEVASETGATRHDAILVVDGRFFLDRNGQLDEITEITAYCLGCHDGSVGPSRQGLVGAGGGDVPRAGGLYGLHPVGQPYPDGDPEFAPLAMLAPGMYVVEGQVTCVSCHSCEATDHALVVDNRQSSLCTTCHRK